ncbi:MAG: TonB-dependent receptor [Rikenellaceae bacterium]|nr:TonB-dependent receptor [Rikenellaceae bacterium]
MLLKFIRKIAIATSIMVLSVASLAAQNRTIRGIVTDAANGSPLTGAMVKVEGGSAVITGLQGEYSIKAAKGQVMEFSFLGMQTQRITVADSDQIDVKMATDDTVLDDVIVVAYGTTKKESFTGSAEVVSGEKLKNRSVTDVTKALDGQVAGVMTTSGGGQPGSGADIRIRGFGSINASNAPLLVVDGVPFDGDLNSINSNDIASMSVLKDASAGALYGARGANGVVLITTKRGKSGEEKVNVQLSAKVGVSDRAIPMYSTMSAGEYMEQMYKAAYNDLVYTEGYLPSKAKEEVVNLLASQILGANNIYNIYDKPLDQLFDENGRIVAGARQKYSTDWLGEVQAKAPLRQEYQLSVNGASAKSKYTTSFSYLDEEGTLKTTGFERFTGRVGLDVTPKKWLDMGLNLNYAHSNSDFLGASGTESSNVWYSAMMMAPIYPIYKVDEKGEYVLENGKKVFDYGQSRPAGAQNNRNSVATLFDDDYYTYSDNLSGRAYMGVNWKGLKLSTNFGLDNVNTDMTTRFNRLNGNAAGSGRLNKTHERVMSYTWNQLLTYQTKVRKHSIDAMLGHEFYHYKYTFRTGEKTGFPFDEFDDLAMGATIADANSGTDLYAINSYMSRLNYSYDDRYYFSASYRMDASSRFKKENRWGSFWSVGASWRLSHEAWLKNVEWINNITLKASYGVQGNDNLGSLYAWQSLYDMNYSNANASGAIIGSVETPDVTWEKNGNLNVGLEFRLFGRLSGTVEWYTRTTSDLLLEHPMAISLGFPGYYANVGSLFNRGWDITIGGDVISTKDWRWNITLMASTLTNRVKQLTGDGEDIVSGNYLIREGEELNTFYLSKSAGIDPATGNQLYFAYKKDENGNRIPGTDYVTNDATVATGCKYLMGSRIPDVYGSISTSLSFRDFDLSVLMTYSLGGKIYDGVYRSLMEPSFVGQTYHRNAMRGWTTQGQLTDVPKVTTTLTTLASDRFLVDASYFAIKNISLGYNLPSKLLSKASIDGLRIYLSADSPWIFTHLQGMNPQASFTGSTSYTYTPNRTFILGVDLKF